MSGARATLTVLFAVNLLNYIDRQLLFAVFPPVQAELGLSDTRLGLLASAFMWVYLCAAPVFGLLGDRGGRPRLLGIGVGLWSAATALSGMARSYAELLVGRALVGIGEASYGAVAPAMLADAYAASRRGKAMALFSMAIPVGSALGYLLGGVFERDVRLADGVPPGGRTGSGRGLVRGPPRRSGSPRVAAGVGGGAAGGCRTTGP